jgi:hypothetical protein
MGSVGGWRERQRGDPAFEAAAAAFELVALGGDGADCVNGFVGVLQVEDGDFVFYSGEEMDAGVGVGEAEGRGDGFGEVIDEFVGC